MKIRIRSIKVTTSKRYFAVGVFCGEKWYSVESWKRYSLFQNLRDENGFAFSIGPLLFWNGN
jgi:hypothetical protein